MEEMALTRLHYTPEKRSRQVKAGFIMQGTTLHAWCLQNGIAPQNAGKALKGDWKGPKATLLVSRILDAAGVQE